MTTDLQARQRDRFVEQVDALAEALSIASEWSRAAEVNAPDEQLTRAARLNAMVRQALIEATRLDQPHQLADEPSDLGRAMDAEQGHHAGGRVMCKGLVCLLTGDFDPALLPPQRVERSVEQCNHTPCPEGYSARYEWSEKASKTHAQVTCPRCGLWAIWLPKAEAREINRREEREAKEFAKQYMEKQRKARNRT